MFISTLLKKTKHSFKPVPMYTEFNPIYSVYDTHSILTFGLPLGEESELDTIMVGDLLIDLTLDGQIAGFQVPIPIEGWREADQADYHDSKPGTCQFDVVDLETSKEVQLLRHDNNFGAVFGRSNYFIQLADCLIVGIGENDFLTSLWLKEVEISYKE